MKKTILSFAVVMSGYCSYAQNTFPSIGRVGIGTTNPSAGLLQIWGNSPSNPALVAVTPGTSQGEVSNISFWSTFQGTSDNSPRRTSDIISGFATGPWGHEYLSFNVGNNGSANDAFLLTAEKMRIMSNGCVGIGTTSPSRQFVVSNSGADGVEILPTTSGGYANVISYNRNTSTWNDFKISASNIIFGWGSTETNEAMRINSSGHILIGKTSQQPNVNYRLDIDGSARANEIVVNTTGADFVFGKNYSLLKLSDVKAYIDENQHLPEMPSAKEMQTNGMNVGEINTKLLQKIEEITLYMIELQKQNADLKKELIRTKTRNHLK